MRNPKIYPKLLLLLLILFHTFQASAIPYEVVVSDETKAINLKLFEVSTACDGSYYSGYVRIRNDTSTPGKCPEN
jgi:hypothetical protein